MVKKVQPGGQGHPGPAARAPVEGGSRTLTQIIAAGQPGSMEPVKRPAPAKAAGSGGAAEEGDA